MFRVIGVMAALSALTASAATQCKSDLECPGREVCAEGKCVLPGHAGSEPSSGGVSASDGRERTGIQPAFQFGIFAEVYPSSSQNVPGSSSGQLAALLGMRLGGGVKLPKWFLAVAMIEGGYAAAGRAPGNGDDGVMIGFAIEAAFTRNETAWPFVRFSYDARVAQLSQESTGTLAESAWAFAFGARLIKTIDAHLLVGSDIAGGFSVGLGFGFYTAN